MLKFWSIIGNGIIAGLIAGFLLTALVLNFSTPLILKAEKYEGQQAADHHEEMANTSEHLEEEASTVNQRNIGTLIGNLIVGIIFGLFLALAYALIGRKLSKKPIVRGLMLGLIAYVLVAFIPSLAFMPAPPGVESKFSASIRQAWWLAVILFELIGLSAYWFIFKQTKINQATRHIVGLSAFVLITAIPFLYGLPNAMLDTIVPRQLITSFQLTSFLVLFAFWTSLGTAIGWVNSKLKIAAQ